MTALSLHPTPEPPAAIDLRSIPVTRYMYRTASALVVALPRIADALGTDLTAPRKDQSHDRR